MFIYVLTLHILAATVWTGGHLILAFTVLPRALKARDTSILLDFEEGFERIGIPALIIQVASGVWMAWYLVPDFSTWFSFESYVETSIAVKLGLLAATAMLALNARFRVIPNLTPETLPLMGWHIRIVTLFAVGFVIAGAALSAGGFW